MATFIWTNSIQPKIYQVDLQSKYALYRFTQHDSESEHISIKGNTPLLTKRFFLAISVCSAVLVSASKTRSCREKLVSHHHPPKPYNQPRHGDPKEREKKTLAPAARPWRRWRGARRRRARTPWAGRP